MQEFANELIERGEAFMCDAKGEELAAERKEKRASRWR
jgi:glutamyl/glutaminyl-tRNA synthetase